MVITAMFDGKTQARKLPHLNRESTFWSYIKSFSKDLKCCPNFLSDVKITGPCIKCSTDNKNKNSILKQPTKQQVNNNTKSNEFTSVKRKREDSPALRSSGN